MLDVPLEELEVLSVRAMIALQKLGVSNLRALGETPPTRMHPRVVAELSLLFAEAGAALPIQITARPTKPRGEPLVLLGSVSERWATIASWLRAHYPALLASFGPPASTQAIRAFEAAIGRTLP